MSTADEREKLQNLVASPGWPVFVAHALDTYDASVLDDITAIYDDPAQSGDLSEAKVRQRLAVRLAVRALVRWPVDRVKELGRLEHHRHAAGQSRRGGL